MKKFDLFGGFHKFFPIFLSVLVLGLFVGTVQGAEREGSTDEPLSSEIYVPKDLIDQQEPQLTVRPKSQLIIKPGTFEYIQAQKVQCQMESCRKMYHEINGLKFFYLWAASAGDDINVTNNPLDPGYNSSAQTCIGYPRNRFDLEVKEAHEKGDLEGTLGKLFFECTGGLNKNATFNNECVNPITVFDATNTPAPLRIYYPFLLNDVNQLQLWSSNDFYFLNNIIDTFNWWTEIPICYLNNNILPHLIDACGSNSCANK